MFKRTKDYGDLFDVPDYDYLNSGGFGSIEEEEIPRVNNNSERIIRSEQRPLTEDDFLKSYFEEEDQSEVDKRNYREARNNRQNNPRENKSSKSKRSNSSPSNKFCKFTRTLSFIYLIALVAFVTVVAIMDLLPIKILLIGLGVLALISVVIFIQLYYKNVKKGAKKLATVVASILILVFSVSTVYGLSTMIFLNEISKENAKSVAVTKEPFNVLLTGIDTTGEIDAEDGRSDVNMIVTVNPTTHQVLLTSIPRDYEVNIVDEGATDKLTHTGFYGVDVTVDSLEDMLDTTINYYVRVNFSTVEKFVDAIGGIDVQSEVAFDPSINARETATDVVPEFHVKKGKNHLNGGQALAFARERKAFDMGDNQRIRNQQIVFTAMLQKATSTRTMAFSYNRILNHLQNYVEMTFSSKEIRQLVKFQLLKNPSWNIMRNQLSGVDSFSSTYTTGYEQVYVMAQDEESVEFAKELIQAVMDGEDGASIQARIDKYQG